MECFDVLFHIQRKKIWDHHYKHHSGNETWTFCENEKNTVDADAMAPSVTRALIQYKDIILPV